MTYLLYVLAALYLGLLTSISPCPLATNIAAISYVARKVGNTRMVVHAGLLYTLGRCLLYLALAALLTMTALSIPAVSIFLQKYMHVVLGPVFLLLGMFLVVEWWARMITGWLFILVGIWFSLAYVFELRRSAG
jgi:cytochrome c biogenesis protein CcdA